MALFILNRLLQSIAVMLTVAIIAFALFNFVGDPITNLVGEGTTVEQRQLLRKSLGLDAPFPVQFARFVVNALHGDFGISYQYGRPVSVIISERLPATLELSAVATLLAMFIGIPAGVFTALKRRSWTSQVLLFLSLVGISLPTFFIGILLIFVFSVSLDWLPSFGRGGTVALGSWSTGLLTREGWKSVIMPAVTLSLFQTAIIMRLIRTEMLEVLRADHIKFARARGLPDRAINFKHALKNTLVPVMTVIGLQIGSVVAFSVVTETVFQWPGMGLLIIEAINFADVPVMSAYLVLIALFFVAINFVIDLLYYVVDPRLRGRT